MINFFYELNPILQSLVASLITFSLTTIGASFVLLFKKINKNVMDGLLGISSGIMFAAAIFSLLIPAIEQSNNLNLNTIIIIPASILIGTLLLIFANKIIEKKLALNNSNSKNIFLLIISIILHNIPEGLAIGVAFASAKILPTVSIASAISLTIGIAIQNLPEGAAISLPLRRAGYSRSFSFIIGSLSGVFEILAAIIGSILVLKVNLILPYFLAFAAGAMLFVVIEELIPESQENTKYKTLIAYLTLVGFVLMMLLEL